jgi:hypothetical protein
MADLYVYVEQIFLRHSTPRERGRIVCGRIVCGSFSIRLITQKIKLKNHQPIKTRYNNCASSKLSTTNTKEDCLIKIGHTGGPPQWKGHYFFNKPTIMKMRHYEIRIDCFPFIKYTTFTPLNNNIKSRTTRTMTPTSFLGPFGRFRIGNCTAFLISLKFLLQILPCKGYNILLFV